MFNPYVDYLKLYAYQFAVPLPQAGVCLSTWACNPNHINNAKRKDINYYGVRDGNFLWVTKDGKNDFYVIPISELDDFEEHLRIVEPWIYQELPTRVKITNNELRERVNAAHLAWKIYRRELKTRLYNLESPTK